ncbi:MAG: hypothetical protein ACXW4E_05470 [Anaerolineales bacterium]
MFTPNERNKYDKKDCLELGQKAEDIFVRIASEKGWDIKPASAAENKDDHFDYQIKKGQGVYKVEVKSKKRIHRADANTQGELVWIELHGVRCHDTGWLYGKADLIAFETNSSFRIVRRLDLIALVQKLVDFKSRVTLARDALYKIYSRSRRHDVLTLLRDEDLKEILWAEWK